MNTSYSYGFRNQSPLTEDQIRRVAPSVFAEDKHDSRSARYSYIPTIDVLRGLQREGFEPFAVMQSRVRSADRRDYTKHMLKLRHVGSLGRALDVGDSVGEISLLNSHDGTSSYKMIGGLFRLVCRNGMMVSDGTLEAVTVPHKGDVKDRVVAGAFEVLDGFTRVVEEHDAMRAMTLPEPVQLALSRAAIAERWADAPAPVTDTQVNEPRRFGDRGADLWTTFNRMQENLVRGGLQGRNAKGRPMTTRAVQGVDADVRLNRGLWVLATELRRALAGEPSQLTAMAA